MLNLTQEMPTEAICIGIFSVILIIGIGLGLTEYYKGKRNKNV